MMPSSDYKRVVDLIQKENPKNPLTDQEISNQLKISRSNVTAFRKQAKIENSRERRSQLLLNEIQNILKAEPKLSKNQITQKLNQRGYRITLNSIISFMKQQTSFLKEEEALTSVQDLAVKESFSTIIGSHRSLSIQVEQAKAAVMYPPIGLHTLIVGKSGVGKSLLAEAMYNFAVKNKPTQAKKIPFVELNCADYAENPQLMTAQLFGYKKDSFTGANEDRDGLICQANGGFFFLDEVHRLPPDGQEMLFQLIDKGIYRRLGDQETKKAQVMIIAATTEDVETSLLNTFRRRIPMVIALPDLAQRGIDEKYDLMTAFFKQEALRVNREIKIYKSAIQKMLATHYPSNIGEMRSNIQVACAKGYLTCMHIADHEASIEIDEATLLGFEKNIPVVDFTPEEITDFVKEDLVVSPKDESLNYEKKVRNPYELSDSLYSIIETEYEKLQQNVNLSENEINSIISRLMEKKISRYINSLHQEKSVHQITESIQSIVNQELLKLVEAMMTLVQKEFGSVDKSLLFCLATHLNASVSRMRKGERVLNPNLGNVKKQYPAEFALAKKMAALSEKHIDLILPDEEIGFIAMYLAATKNGNEEIGKAIGIIVVTHGRVAAEMVAVANELMGKSHVAYLCVNLDERPSSIYQRLLEKVQKNDQGRGVLILVDMGSPERLVKRISEETGISIRTVSRVDTLMVLDAIRKTQLLDMNLAEVAQSLMTKKDSKILEETPQKNEKKSAFVFYCLTGQGCATLLSDYLRDKVLGIFPEVQFIYLNMLQEQSLENQLQNIMNQYEVVGCAGSFKLPVHGLPLFLMEDLVDKNRLLQFLNELKRQQQMLVLRQPKEKSLLEEELIFFSDGIDTKEAALLFLGEKLKEKNKVTSAFINTVFERESIVPTILETGAAIPHGYFSEVKNSQIAVLIPKEPILWGFDKAAKAIFLLAFTEEETPLFSRIYHNISNAETIQKIAASHDKATIKAYIEKGLPVCP